MATTYLHDRKDFPALLRIIGNDMGIVPGLVEKDYWIMHVLNGLSLNGFEFELKGGTSLSKGFKIIDRFSEDIDIHIKPSIQFGINENPKNTNKNNILAKKLFYDWLTKNINIEGIASVERDTAFDDKEYYRSGGIRLTYTTKTNPVQGLKEGILLEVGFDNTAPNIAANVSSWAYDTISRAKGVEVKDNRAMNIPCYHPGYTLVEKLQTIATKFRLENQSKVTRPNFMRQYYDVYCLLNDKSVNAFIGTIAFHQHKKKRFPNIDFETPLIHNQAFLLEDNQIRNDYKKRYYDTSALYYKGQPDFDTILTFIKTKLPLL